MLFCKILKKNAEDLKRYLVENNLFDKQGKHIIEKDHILFPVTSKFSYKGVSFEKRDIEVKVEKSFKDLLYEKLNDKEISNLKTSYDQVGTIAILEIDDELKDKEKLIGECLLDSSKTIKTVLKKSGHHSGEFRTQNMKYLAGIYTKETITKENGISLKINVEDVYYSVRLSTERKRISVLVKSGEEILVMFSGAAPYPSVLSKNTDAKMIYGIEMNPEGHRMGLENVKLNKLLNVELINGDVRKVIPKKFNKKKFDRILMPLPKSAEDFLDVALSVCKNGSVVHFYDFLNEDEFDKAYDKVKKACERNNMKCEFLDFVKCGQHAPYVFRICLDFKVI